MNRWHGLPFWIFLGILAATGGGLFYFKNFGAPPLDPFSVVSHPIEPWLLKFHVLVAPIFVFLLGGIWLAHVLPRHESGLRQGNRTGRISIVLTALLVASGYVTQIVTHERALEILKYVHFGLGALFTLTALAHLIVTWKVRKLVVGRG